MDNLKRKLPFDATRPADEESFVGRKELLDAIVTGITLSSYSYGIIGGPGVGKTSFLFAIQREILKMPADKLPYIVIPVYVQIGPNITNADQLLSAFMLGLEESLYEKWKSPKKYTAQQLSSKVSKGQFPQILKDILDAQFREQGLVRPVLILDDLHRAKGEDWLSQAFSVLRPLISNKKLLQVILSGELPLEEEFRNDISPLRNLVNDQITLQPFSAIEIGKLLDVARRYGWPIVDGCELSFHNMTSGFPYGLVYYISHALQTYQKIDTEIIDKLSQNNEMHSWVNSLLKGKPHPVIGTRQSQETSTMQERDHTEQSTVVDSSQSNTGSNAPLRDAIRQIRSVEDSGVRAILIALALILIGGLSYVAIVRDAVQLVTVVLVILVTLSLTIFAVLRLRSVETANTQIDAKQRAQHVLIVHVFRDGKPSNWVKGAEVRLITKENLKQISNRFGQVTFHYPASYTTENQRATLMAVKGDFEGTYGPFPLSGQNHPIELELKKKASK